MHTPLFRRLLQGLVVLFALMPNLGLASEEPLEALAPADLAASVCTAYPEACAEVLVEKLVYDTTQEAVREFYFKRVKVYDAARAEAEGVLGFEYSKFATVSALSVKVLKKEGPSADFGREGMQDRLPSGQAPTTTRLLTLKGGSVSSGDVVEFSWTLTGTPWLYPGPSWYFQSSVPVRHFLFAIEPGDHDTFFGLRYFNAKDVKVSSKGLGAIRMSVSNLPPFSAEPFMPPEHDLRGWFQIHGELEEKRMKWRNMKEKEYMELMSSENEEDFRLLTAPTRVVKEKAAALVKGLASEEEKLNALADFVRITISNTMLERKAGTSDMVVFDFSNFRRRPSSTPEQTLAKGQGTPPELNALFASLAKAAGFDARRALSASRESTVNVTTDNRWTLMPDEIVAIRTGTTWRYFNPGSPFTPSGMLRPRNEGVTNLIFDPNLVLFTTNPIAPADKTLVQRAGKFRLDREGNLEGEVTLTWGGHAGELRKEAWLEASDTEIEGFLAHELQARLPAAKIATVALENRRDLKLPLIARYSVQIPAYGKSTQEALTFAPNVFESGAAALFQATTRKYPLLFDFARREHDEIEIELPDGYVPEGASPLQNVGDLAGALGTRYQVGYSAKAHKLVYRRDFVLGAKGEIAFPVSSYPSLKQAFDAIQKSDQQSFVFRASSQVSSPASAKPGASQKP